MPLADKLKKVDVSCDDILVSARQNNGITKLSEIKYAILGTMAIFPLFLRKMRGLMMSNLYHDNTITVAELTKTWRAG